MQRSGIPAPRHPGIPTARPTDPTLHRPAPPDPVGTSSPLFHPSPDVFGSTLTPSVRRTDVFRSTPDLFRPSPDLYVRRATLFDPTPEVFRPTLALSVRRTHVLRPTPDVLGPSPDLCVRRAPSRASPPPHRFRHPATEAGDGTGGWVRRDPPGSG